MAGLGHKVYRHGPAGNLIRGR